ncbi:MAG: hypothetical protein AB7V77_01145 [Candidatus Woesearchaeota archaeon]
MKKMDHSSKRYLLLVVLLLTVGVVSSVTYITSDYIKTDDVYSESGTINFKNDTVVEGSLQIKLDDDSNYIMGIDSEDNYFKLVPITDDFDDFDANSFIMNQDGEVSIRHLYSYNTYVNSMSFFPNEGIKIGVSSNINGSENGIAIGDYSTTNHYYVRYPYGSACPSVSWSNELSEFPPITGLATGSESPVDCPEKSYYPIAIGFNSTANYDYSTSIGYTSSATGTGAITLGSYAGSVADYGIAIGSYAYAEGISSIAIGDSSYAEGEHSTAIGYYSQCSGINSTCIGSSAYSDYNSTLYVGGDVYNTFLDTNLEVAGEVMIYPAESWINIGNGGGIYWNSTHTCIVGPSGIANAICTN